MSAVWTTRNQTSIRECTKALRKHLLRGIAAVKNSSMHVMGENPFWDCLRTEIILFMLLMILYVF